MNLLLHQLTVFGRKENSGVNIIQGRQRHRKGGTAHNRSTPLKAVPGGALCVGGAKCRSVRAKRGKKFSHVFLAKRKRSRSIQTAVLGKKRPWLVWSINGRPRKLGRETDAIAESVLLIIWSARKVVRPKPDQPDWRRRHCNRYN